MIYALNHKTHVQFRVFFDSVARRKPDDISWSDWLEERDLLAYGQKLAPWLDGLCRIQVPAHMTKSGKVEEFTFTPDGLDIFEKPSYGPHSYQDMTDAVYKTAGTADQ